MDGTQLPQKRFEENVAGQSTVDGPIGTSIQEIGDRRARESCNHINSKASQLRSNKSKLTTPDSSTGNDECRSEHMRNKYCDDIVEHFSIKTFDGVEKNFHTKVLDSKGDKRQTKTSEDKQENIPYKADDSHLSHATRDDAEHQLRQSNLRKIQKLSLNTNSSRCAEGDAIKEQEMATNRVDSSESITGCPTVDDSLANILDFQSEEYIMKGPFDIDKYPSAMKKRKALLSPPDPRPFFGCTWCGPRVKPNKKFLIQIKGDVCPACKYFLDIGWKRIYLESSSKITFKGPGEQTMGSVRDFLKKSTQILSQKLGESKVSVPSNQDNNAGAEMSVKTGTSHNIKAGIKKRVKEAKKSPRTKMAPERLTATEKKRPVKKKFPHLKRNTNKVSADESPIPAWANSSMMKRKMLVCANDPRPVFGCEWCGPSMQRDYPSNEGNICETCQVFAERMTRYYSKSARKCYFYDKNGKIRYESTLQYLKGTTKFLSDQTNNDDPEISDKGLREDDIIIPNWAKKCIEARKQYVSAPDKRPTFGCTWCGPRMKEEYIAPTLMGSNVCPTCTLCQDLGWKLKSYETSKHFMNKKGEQHSGVKEYLIATTPIVCKKMKTMSKSDLRALIPKYRPPDRTFAEEPSKRSVSLVSIEDSRLPVKRGNDAIEPPQPPKQEVIELPTVMQLLREEKGLMGVLQADVFRVFNIHFGTNQSIAAKIMLCLGKGQIPSRVLDEIPIAKDSSAPETNSTQFIGAVRVGNTKNTTYKCGVAIPQFYVDCKELQESSIKYKNKDYVIPRETTVNGQILLVRDDIEDEKIAGQCFAFMYRILYGSRMVASVVADYNMKKIDKA